MSAFDANLSRVRARFDEVKALMAQPDMDAADFTRLSREYAELEPVAAAIDDLEAVRGELRDLDDVLAEIDAEPEMRVMAEEEQRELRRKLPEMERALQLMLVPRDEADSKNAILEIRAGTGGDEAALFAGDLLTMYRAYAQLRGWRFDVMELAETDLGGLKQAIVNISGDAVFARLKFESGVHRVQRVPKTETQGRIHTSAATVAVLPEAEEVDIELREEDLRIDTFRSQGAGGQHVNTTDSAVRITHIPTGVVVSQQDEKSQHKNKARALKILRARLYEAERERLATERAADRKDQVGSGDRSERIRTYNFPQGRVTDHRVNVTLYKLDRVISGEALDEIIEPLIADDQAARLAAMET